MTAFFARMLTDSSMVFLLLLTGGMLTLRFRFYQLRGLPYIIRYTLLTLFQKDDRKSKGGISPFQAMTTALAGTMGVGNIAGVATALVAGGPGAILWMWVSAFLGMMTKYAEIFLAVRYRRKDSSGSFYGGPMYYMQDGLGRPRMAAVFALLCMLCSFGIGNLAQINSVAGAMEESFGTPPLATGLVFSLLLALVIFGGVQRIARITELIIPFISILYLCFAAAFLFIQRTSLPGIFASMLSGAVGLRPAAGGAMGYGVAQAFRMGLTRGVFTNEAGLGSAPIAHAAADCESPSRQAVWGIFEVFLDTIVVCTITALVILSADGGTLWQSGLDGAPLTSQAFESLFQGIGARFVSLSIVFFAFAAMLGWCYYGEQALGYLSGKNPYAVNLYRIAFLVCAVLGAVSSLELVWGLSDLLNALMAVPNVIALLALRREVSVELLPRPRRKRNAIRMPGQAGRKRYR